MKEWYLRQSPRDRMIILCVGFLCLVGALYAFVWFPLQEGLDQKRALINSKQKDLAFMQNAAPRIKGSGGTGTVVKTSDKAPYLLIDEIIRNAGLNPPQRVEPTGSDGARVQFAEVEFDKLVQVIAELELYGLSLSTLNISKKNTGTVSARFNMERG